MYFKIPYPFQPIPLIQEFILSGIGLEESECFLLSTHLEARSAQSIYENNVKVHILCKFLKIEGNGKSGFISSTFKGTSK